jgi:hypothetical protein
MAKTAPASVAAVTPSARESVNSVSKKMLGRGGGSLSREVKENRRPKAELRIASLVPEQFNQ